jgi:hypothetical protein
MLATQEAEIRRIMIQSQPRQIVHKTLSLKNPSQKKRAGGAAQGESHEFKPQWGKKKYIELPFDPVIPLLIHPRKDVSQHTIETLHTHDYHNTIHNS